MKNTVIKPIEHLNLPLNKEYLVFYRGKSVLCRILYVFPRKNMDYDEKGMLTGKFEWVAHKIGFIPTKTEFSYIFDKKYVVESTHICCGGFTIKSIEE